MNQRFELLPLSHSPGIFISCRILADANDIDEALRDSGAYQYLRVGYTGIWLADASAIDYLMRELPYCSQIPLNDLENTP
jgi:hypothetical protein